MHDMSPLFIELGLAILALAVLARLASRWGFSAIPLYLIAGLSVGKGGFAPLNLSQEFIHVGAEIGVLLLLFMLGLEYTQEELKRSLRRGFSAGIIDLVLNFLPGFLAGILLRWNVLASLLLGGVTYVSSSGVIAKVLTDLKRLGNPETPIVLSILVFEDLVMAVYLPLVGVLLVGGGTSKIILAVAIAAVVVVLVLFVALKYGTRLSVFAAHQSDEVILLTIFGTVLLVGGVAQHFQVSAAIGAFLVGIAVSGPIAEQSRRLLAPLRDLFAATFFFFFGMQTDPASLTSALPLAIGLGIVTAATKIIAGRWTVRRMGIDARGSWRAGVELVAHGEFSIVIAWPRAGFGATTSSAFRSLCFAASDSRTSAGAAGEVTSRCDE
jgi:monovalent cation:H+ antiporter-2, CPA2 family